jgi:hypothetical protein
MRENETTTKRPWRDEAGKSAALTAWRESYPNRPDPNDDFLHGWLAGIEHESMTNKWIEANPDKSLPDFALVRRWCIWQQQQRYYAMERDLGDK